MQEGTHEQSDITNRIISSINFIRDHVYNFNNDPDFINNISNELMLLRRNWREMTNYLIRLEDTNENLKKWIKNSELSVGECVERIASISNVSNSIEIGTNPSFELLLRCNCDDIDLTETNGSVHLSYETIKKMNNNLDEKKELEVELQRYIEEYAKMFYELEILKRRSKDLIEYAKPFSKTMENIKSFIEETNTIDCDSQTYKDLAALTNHLKPIYIFFNPVVVRTRKIKEYGNIMDMNIDRYGRLNILYNKPLSKIVKGISSKHYFEFIDLFFPIRLEFSTMPVGESTEAVLVSVYLNNDKLVKFHILSDILFQGDFGSYVDLKTNQYEECNESNCGIPYYWIQFLINNNEIIPINISEINVITSDIYKIIYLRTQNLTFFNLVVYLASKDPACFIDFISESIGNSKLTKKPTCNLQGYDVANAHIMDELSFNVNFEGKKYEIYINFSGNISYNIRKDRVNIQRAFTTRGNHFVDTLEYNTDLILNFCSDLFKLIQT